MDTSVRQTLERATQALPFFPLPNVVFLPSTLLPLHIFEPRYRKLVADSLSRDGIFSVALLRDGWHEDDGLPPVYPVAGVGRIVRCQRLDAGRYNLLLLGLGRVALEEEIPTEDPYRVARARLLDVTRPSPQETVSLAGGLRVVAGQLMAAHPGLAGEFNRVLTHAEDPVQLVDMLAHLALRETGERQRYLETDELVDRVDQVYRGLASLLAPQVGIEA